MKESPSKEPWYKEGLPFSCTGCGKCCTGSPGYVWVNSDEIKALADHLSITCEDFIRKYTRNVDGRLSLNELPTHYDCVFLKNNQCTVYAARPVQCRTFPWWTSTLKSRKDWEEAALFCEGISPDAPQVKLKIIQDQLHEYENARSKS